MSAPETTPPALAGTPREQREDPAIEPGGGAVQGPRRWLHRLLTDRVAATRFVNRVTFLSVLAFAILGIGTPLLGLTVFANTDLLVRWSPYVNAGLATPGVQNWLANDIVAAVLPNTNLFADELRQGRIASWNPYVGGGGSLGAVPNYAVLSPLSLPYYLLPPALAPGYVKLLEIAVAVGGCFLFLRRLRLDRAAALLGGLVFASSAFMVMWTNWPQTRVAAFIPMVFWATERLVTQRRVRDVALLAAAVAAMLFGGFPAVTGYTVLTAGCYFLVRAIAEHPGRWRRVAGTVAAGVAALAGAVIITAIQLLPFVSAMSHVKLSSRDQTPADHIDPASLITVVAPWALGGVNSFALSDNAIESMSYVGAVAVVLAFVAIAMPTAARSFLPRGVWSFLVAAVVVWTVLIYFGGWPLAALQQLPVLFSGNFVGRGRSLLGFLLAVLVAVGFDLLRRRALGTEAVPPTGSALPAGSAAAARTPATGLAWRRGYAIAVATIGVASLALAIWGGRRAAGAAENPVAQLARFDRHVFVGLVLLAATGFCLSVLWWARSDVREGRRWRLATTGAAVAVPLLIALQALSLVHPFWPAVERRTFYPTTEVHEFLADNLGHERFAAADTGMYPGADSAARLRSLTGETFFQARFAETVEALPGELFGTTLLRLPASLEMAQSPVLDRLSVRYLVNPPAATVFGPVAVATGDGSVATLAPGSPVTVPMDARGPLRAVGVTLPDVSIRRARLDVSVQDATGRELIAGSRPIQRAVAGEPFFVPVAGEQIPPDLPLSAVLTLRGGRPVEVIGAGGAPAISTVGVESDGLALVHAGDSVVWQRLTALPRVRWASEAIVEPDQGQRLAALASSTLGPDQVLLEVPPAQPPSGLPATIDVTEDGTDSIEVVVDAEGAGQLVVADALQAGWVASVDGVPADLVPADHGLVSVAVPAGRHTVRLAYEMPYQNVGAWLSGAGLLGLAGVGAGVFIRRRRTDAGSTAP